MTNVTNHCIWLTFKSQSLEEIIINLANRFQSPVFQPHCTLIGRTNIPVVKLKSAITNVIGLLDITKVKIEKINFSEYYWRSYYLELKESNTIIRLYKKLTELLSLETSDDYFPHISLMYNNVSREIKSEIVLPINMKNAIKLRSIQITECDDNIENWRPVFELIINN